MRLDMQIQYPRLQLQHQRAVLAVDQQMVQADIKIQGPELDIDQSAPMAEIGMGSQPVFMQNQVQQARQEALAGIARIAAEGDRLAQEMTRQDTFVQMAKESNTSDIPELNVAAVPQSRPDITVYYDLHIDWIPGQVTTHFTPARFHLHLEAGSVAIAATGRNVDKRG